MRYRMLHSMFLLLAVSGVTGDAPAFAANPAPVLHAEIRGTINPATTEYLETSIHLAESRSASALVVSLDTPGGLVTSVEKMAQAIAGAKVPVVVYVEPAGAAATSAGSLLLLASHVAAMTPGSHMGSAHPVDSHGGDIQGAMGEKVLNDTSAFAESIATLRGRDPKLAAEIVRKSRSFTATEAYDAKLVEILADSFPDLLRKLSGRTVKLTENQSVKLGALEQATVEPLEMTRGQHLLHLLSDPNIAAILMTLGMLLIYAELNHPGIQVAGILGAICFIIAFMSFQTLPIRTGGLLLMIAGGIGLIAEVFATTHGTLGAAGVLSFVLGMIWVIDPNQLHGVSPVVYIPAGVFLAGFAFTIAWFASRTKAAAHAALERMKGGGLAGLQGYVGRVEADGKLLIRGELWDFVSKDSVRVGDTVEVVGVDGLKAVVRPRKRN